MYQCPNCLGVDGHLRICMACAGCGGSAIGNGNIKHATNCPEAQQSVMPGTAQTKDGWKDRDFEKPLLSKWGKCECGSGNDDAGPAHSSWCQQWRDQ